MHPLTDVSNPDSDASRVVFTMTAITADTRVEIERLERKHAENPEGRYFVPLANAYRKSGEVDRAIRVLRQGLAKHPDYVSAHIVLGRCFRDEGNVDAAGAEFQHVLTLDTQNLVALRMLGELAAEDGNDDEALVPDLAQLEQLIGDSLREAA